MPDTSGLPIDGGRILRRGSCRWEWREDCLRQLNQLHALDQRAYGQFMDMVVRSESPSGIEPFETNEGHRIPLIFARIPRPPWMAELKLTAARVFAKRNHPRFEHRLHFGAPVNADGIVVGVGAGSKFVCPAGVARKPLPDRLRLPDRTGQIKRAMSSLKREFGVRGYHWSEPD